MYVAGVYCFMNINFFSYYIWVSIDLSTKWLIIIIICERFEALIK